MRKSLFCLFVCLNICIFIKAQEIVVLDTSMFEKNFQTIWLARLNGWIFHDGNDLKWIANNVDTTGWKRLSPTAISMKDADKNGRAEGWYRLQFKLDSSFSNVPLTLHLERWLAMDIYIDGRHIASLGNTGSNGRPYEESSTYYSHSPILPLSFKPGEVHVMAVHFVDYVSPLNPWKLKSEVDNPFSISLAGPESQKKMNDNLQNVSMFFTLFTSVCAVLCLLFWFLYFQNPAEKVLLFISLGTTFFSLQNCCTCIYSLGKVSFVTMNLALYLSPFFAGLALYFTTRILATIFKTRIKAIFFPFILLVSVLPSAGNYISSIAVYTGPLYLLIPVFYGYLVISSWKNLKGAQWSVVAGLIATFTFGGLFTYQFSKAQYTWPFPYCYVLAGASALSLPLSLMVYVAIRFKEILTDVQTNAKQVLQLSEEKKEQALRQQKILEEEVARQTIELRTSFENLKSTQAQLIQSEKMASLGELTAGIAHEIQNPLNFVNNFSDVNKELLEELQEEAAKGNIDEVKTIATDVIANEEKINHHGKRADAIVKGMLQHSRLSTGEKEATDINKLADEYLRLAYQGMRAKDNAFNTEIKTEFDESIGNINIVPQDIGRMLLNLYNNAFYAVNEKAKLQAAGYKPEVCVTTKKMNGKIEISVRDNGNGIPQKIVDKIFQPFFTTKPTGSGTGLGLSLSYDIVKAHGGEIKVISKVDEGNPGQSGKREGTEFIIALPD